ncbi:cytochrome o ubiquinol oxidase subunit IV [Candidatus Pantoea edessiphila]|uniref:Cytochrome bo(3) ubiquinol oxidase subunit 4 n=1 Tax=Candidatus Pantoea edessiphila TaxID=2044610 RepID=A0A2P5T1E8_9GAMM|nr:cytochrome o ubiquinol oxidase subunit IV [Candidatus Pantoea edessiphila]PPI88398.1 cytochrome o ubiquinol oxidase subunit IV [Candidatus Pantoea edessiphila]
MNHVLNKSKCNDISLPHKNIKSYIIGFFLSVILTVIPFWIVIAKNTSYHIAISVVVGCAIIQILVHLFCFLHLDNKSEEGWNLISLIFASLIILIIVTGSIWIMWNLNYNMMIR